MVKSRGQGGGGNNIVFRAKISFESYETFIIYYELILRVQVHPGRRPAEKGIFYMKRESKKTPSSGVPKQIF